jgi:hypothetical protein
MFGPVLKDLTKNHREKQERDNYNKIEEIKKLYANCDVTVPIKVQLEYPRQTSEAFTQVNKPVPQIAKKKVRLQNILGFSFFLLIILDVFYMTNYSNLFNEEDFGKFVKILLLNITLTFIFGILIFKISTMLFDQKWGK